MKTTNTINILALLLSLLFFVGCEKDVNDERLRVTPEIIEIGSEGGTVQVDIESTSGWEVIVPSDCTWVKSDRYESEVGRRQWIKLSISKNKTESTRKATITICNRGLSRQVAITQSALSFDVTPESIDVGIDKTTQDITINSNISWSAKASDSWFSLSKNSGNAGNSKISVTIAKNTTGDARTGHVEIYNHDYNLTKSVTITQEAATIRVNSGTVEVGPEAATRNVTVTSNIDWMAKTSANWITISKNSGSAGTTTLAVNIGANTSTSSRSGYVEFYNTEYNVSKKVDINQIAFCPEITVSPNSFNVEASEVTKTLNVDSNIEWTAKTSKSWIYVSKLSGSAGTTTLTIDIGANTSTSSRSGYVEFYNTDYNLTKSVTITQEAVTIRVNSGTVEVGPEAATRNVTVTSDIDWMAKTSANWIILSKNSGYAGTTSLTINIGANTSTSSRSGYVEFYNTEYNVSKKVDINQIAFCPEITVSPNSFDVGAEATTKTLTIESNISWTAKTSSSWIYVSKLSDSAGTTTLTIDIDANTSTSSRSGYVEFYNTEYNVSKKVDINQYLAEFIETIENLNMKMIYVEGGTFAMGSNDGYDDDKPVHNVTLDSYYIGETEITQAQWRAIMGSNPSSYTGDNHPVEYVSWEDAQEFCKKLSELTGKKYVLPTEAQWEYAARGGNKSKGYTYSGSNNVDDVAVYDTSSHSNVKSKKPNELGIYDMTGNVSEWCSDWYGYYSSSPQTNPQGPSSGSSRVLRGGSWLNFSRHCRAADRDYKKPYYRYSNIGFRVVCLP